MLLQRSCQFSIPTQDSLAVTVLRPEQLCSLCCELVIGQDALRVQVTELAQLICGGLRCRFWCCGRCAWCCGRCAWCCGRCAWCCARCAWCLLRGSGLRLPLGAPLGVLVADGIGCGIDGCGGRCRSLRRRVLHPVHPAPARGGRWSSNWVGNSIRDGVGGDSTRIGNVVSPCAAIPIPQLVTSGGICKPSCCRGHVLLQVMGHLCRR